MVYERAQLYIAAGSEPAFEAAMSECIGLLQSATGCQAAHLAQGVEETSTYLLLVEWGAVEDHVAFTNTSPSPLRSFTSPPCRSGLLHARRANAAAEADQ
jgi:heme-degrading monooxygenase HmoA